MFAHSMGNIVASEALRIEATSPNPKKLVHVYVASQAAVPADAYDPTKATDPDLYSNFDPTAAQPQYFANIGTVADHIVNFYNPLDYATNSAATWPLNESLKPDNGYVPIWSTATDQIVGYKTAPFGRELNLELNLDRYETFAFAVRPNSKALGATPGVAGPFDTAAEVDLSNIMAIGGGATRDANYTKNQWDHSAEFNGTNMVRKYYWNLLMKAFGLTPWDPTQTTYKTLK